MQTRCDEVAEALVAEGLHAVALHGGRNQSEREAALRDFRTGFTIILVYLPFSHALLKVLIDLCLGLYFINWVLILLIGL